jgi:hypothetical protein
MRILYGYYIPSQRKKQARTSKGEQMRFDAIKTDATTNSKTIEHHGVTYYQPGSENQQTDEEEKRHFSDWRDNLIKFWENKGDLIEEKMRTEKLEIEDYRKEVGRIFYNYREPENDPIIKYMVEYIILYGEQQEKYYLLKNVIECIIQSKEEQENDPIKRERFLHYMREFEKIFKEKSKKNDGVLLTDEELKNVNGIFARAFSIDLELEEKEKEIVSLMKELNLRKLKKGINSLTKKLDSLTKELNLWVPEKLDSWTKEELDLLTKFINSLIKGWIDSPINNINSQIRKKIDSLAEKRYFQIITNSLTKEERYSLIKEILNSLIPKKLDSLTKEECSSLTEEERDSLTKELIFLNSQIKEWLDSQINNINSLAEVLFLQRIINLWTKEKLYLLTKEILDSLIKEPDSRIKKEIDSLIEKRNSLIGKLNSQIEKIDLLTKKIRIKINPQTKNIQKEEIC